MSTIHIALLVVDISYCDSAIFRIGCNAWWFEYEGDVMVIWWLRWYDKGDMMVIWLRWYDDGDDGAMMMMVMMMMMMMIWWHNDEERLCEYGDMMMVIWWLYG